MTLNANYERRHPMEENEKHTILILIIKKYVQSNPTMTSFSITPTPPSPKVNIKSEYSHTLLSIILSEYYRARTKYNTTRITCKSERKQSDHKTMQ